MKKVLSAAVFIFAGLFLFAGCAGTQKADVTPTTPIQDTGAPAWVIKGSGSSASAQGKVFYGVGSASGMKNMSLLRSSADNRARNEIAKTFSTYTSSLMKDYMASTTAGNPNVTSEEQHVEQAIKTITSATLVGVEIVDHWQNPATGEFYSLARLDLEFMKNSLESMKELDRKTKEYIRQNAEKLHEQLSREEEKLKEKQ
jgi:hypothetical protein